MVQSLLSFGSWRCLRRAASVACLVLSLVGAAFGAKREKTASLQAPPDLLLEGGRSLSFERAIHSEADIRGKKSFWSKVVDVIAGEADHPEMVRPYSVAVDSHGRIIVTDPGMAAVHIFDPEQHKYRIIERRDEPKDPMIAPQCVAVDAEGRIYVTDSTVGKVFVFDVNGKYHGVLGSLKGGEGFFKRATGIAMDQATQEIYVTDTSRDRVFILNKRGQVLRSIGRHGSDRGEFNFPTEVLIKNSTIVVVDAMNFRVQIFDRQGTFVAAIGELGDAAGQMFRPKGIALDSEGHIYIAEGISGMVQVFDRQGRWLYKFGKTGTALGEYQLPAGLFIDDHDRVFVVDSYNRRLQIYQYHALKSGSAKPGAGQ